MSKIPNVGSQILVLGLGENDDSQFFTLESLGKSMEIVWGDEHLLKARSCGVVEMNIHSYQMGKRDHSSFKLFCILCLPLVYQGNSSNCSFQ